MYTTVFGKGVFGKGVFGFFCVLLCPKDVVAELILVIDIKAPSLYIVYY